MQHFVRLSLLPILLAATATPALAQLQEGEAPTPEQIQAGEAPATPIPEGETALRALQSQAAATPWTRKAAQDLLAYVQRVGEEGLDPLDYNPERLNAGIQSGDDAAMSAVASDTFLRLSSDLALGHVRGDARIDWHMQDPDLDGNEQYALMQRAVQNDSVRDTLTSLLPTHPQYAELKQVLADATDQTVIDKVRVNLDRWRWLPRDLGKRYVIVNVPAYTVALVEDGQVVARHRVVVGKPSTATPQLSATATGVILNPWWEVPQSIADEVRGKKGFVSVKDGDNVRFRQPPGATNSLGRMKVVMPNNYAIYLHDTPAKTLFGKQARAFSHGCIRTQDALGFAQILLANPQWSKASIAQQIASGKTIEAQATIPTPVYITYFTAAAARDKGGIITYGDIYGRDSTVVASLHDRNGTTLAAAN
jgi:murein L,D-transpeptidase YcbB/YkuD